MMFYLNNLVIILDDQYIGTTGLVPIKGTLKPPLIDSKSFKSMLCKSKLFFFNILIYPLVKKLLKMLI